MSGRKQEKCYHYDISGEYLGEFKSISDARRMYYSDCVGKYPMFRKNKYIHILPDETVLSKDRIGREFIVRFIKISKNKFNTNDNNPIELFDITGSKVAEFINKEACCLISGLTKNQINSYLRPRKGKLPKNNLGLTFKLKE